MHKRLAKFMRRYGISPKGVIHVGAHTAQELPIYQSCGMERQVWVEPQPSVFARLKTKLPQSPSVHAFMVACGETPGEATMYEVANNDGLSNSLLKPEGITTFYPELKAGGTLQVPVVRLDDLLASNGLSPGDFSLLSLDVQGFEMHVLRGAPKTIDAMEAIITEVSMKPHYQGSALLPEMDAFMRERGFVRAQSRLRSHRQHGDALYVRAAKITPFRRFMLSTIGPGVR